MTTLVTIQYPTGSTFTQVMAVIQFSDAALEIGGSNNLVLNGTFTFSQMTVLSNEIQFQNNAAGSAVAGSVAIPVVPTGSNPSVMVTNFTGQGQVSYGSNFFPMNANDPVPLGGLS